VGDARRGDQPRGLLPHPAALIIPVEMILALVWGLESHNGGWWKGRARVIRLPHTALPAIAALAVAACLFARSDRLYVLSFNQMLLVMLNGLLPALAGCSPRRRCGRPASCCSSAR